MLDPEIVDSLEIISNSIEIVNNRYDYLQKMGIPVDSELGITFLDSIAIHLLLIGEKTKDLDRKNPGLLARHGIDPQPVIRTRDFLSHHYERVDYASIVEICNTDLPELGTKIKAMIGEI